MGLFFTKNGLLEYKMEQETERKAPFCRKSHIHGFHAREHYFIL